MDELPFVAPVYRRDLTLRNYFIGYLKHPYVSLYTGRGCRSKCTFCLWPQTVGGHRYRVRSSANVLAEVAWIRAHMPEVREIMFDDDTFTDSANLARVEEIARGLGRLGVTWSCNAKANVPYATLKVMKDNGLRLLLVGYESGDDAILHNIKKGLRTDIARRFARDCRRLGITVHGTFILGLPGETAETIRRTIEFAKEINPHTIQVSLAAPYPGTTLHAQALEQGWLKEEAGGATGERRRCAARRAQLPASVERGDLRRSRDLLPSVLLPSGKDLGNRPRDARQPRDDAPPPARGCRVLPLPAHARRLSRSGAPMALHTLLSIIGVTLLFAAAAHAF